MAYIDDLDTCPDCGHDKAIGQACWACKVIFAGEDGD